MCLHRRPGSCLHTIQSLSQHLSPIHGFFLISKCSKWIPALSTRHTPCLFSLAAFSYAILICLISSLPVVCWAKNTADTVLSFCAPWFEEEALFDMSTISGCSILSSLISLLPLFLFQLFLDMSLESTLLLYGSRPGLCTCAHSLICLEAFLLFPIRPAFMISNLLVLLYLMRITSKHLSSNSAVFPQILRQYWDEPVDKTNLCSSYVQSNNR